MFVFFLDAVQRFIEMPTYTEVNPGEDALLKCRISDKKGVCSWQKDNKVCRLVLQCVPTPYRIKKNRMFALKGLHVFFSIRRTA